MAVPIEAERKYSIKFSEFLNLIIIIVGWIFSWLQLSVVAFI